MDGNNGIKKPQRMGQRNPDQYRRTFNLQNLNRTRINEDPHVKPPVRAYDANHVILNVPHDEEYVEPTKEINWVHDDNDAIHLTQYEYEIYLHEDVYQKELKTHKRYLLRP